MASRRPFGVGLCCLHHSRHPSALSLAFIPPTHSTWSRRVVRSLQLEACLCSVSIVMPSRSHSMTRLCIVPLYSRSGSHPSTCFLISYFLDIVLMRNSTAVRCPPIVMSSPCTVATTSSPLMRLSTRMGTRFLVDPRPLSVDASSSSQFCAASRVPYRLYRSSPHMCSLPGW